MRPEIEKFEKHTEKDKKKIDIICQAAAKVFYEKGFLSATLADISSAAGTTKGSIFLFFATKDELLFLILYRYHELALAQLKQELNSSNSAYEKIYTYIRNYGLPRLPVLPLTSGVTIARTILLICQIDESTGHAGSGILPFR